MARTANPLSQLLKSFSSEIEAAVAARVNEEFAARFDDLRDSVISAVSQGKTVKGRRGRPSLGGLSLRRKPGPKAGTITAELKPCPVCGEKNKARRYSYLCDKHRSDDNLSKFKSARSGGKGAVPAVKVGRKAKVAGKVVKTAKPPKAAKAKTGNAGRKAAKVAKVAAAAGETTTA
jgi:hypothetical protein